MHMRVMEMWGIVCIWRHVWLEIVAAGAKFVDTECIIEDG